MCYQLQRVVGIFWVSGSVEAILVRKRIDQLQTGCSHHNLYDNCYPLNATFSSKESQMLSAILDFGGHIAFSSLFMTMSYLNGHRIHMDITIFSKIWQIVPKGL